MVKKCGKCGEAKSLTEFYKNKARHDGVDSRCKLCRKKYRSKKSHSTKLAERRWAYANSQKIKEANKRHEVRKKYGISLEEYRIRMKSSSRCECCGSETDLCYDHCHETMEFRGVLCRQCNRGIGQLGDNYDGVARAVKYLSRQSKEKRGQTYGEGGIQAVNYTSHFSLKTIKCVVYLTINTTKLQLYTKTHIATKIILHN
jgi:hypothetical protein